MSLIDDLTLKFLSSNQKSTTFICKSIWLTTWQTSQLRSRSISRYLTSVFVFRRVVASVDFVVSVDFVDSFASFDVVSSIDSASLSSFSKMILLSIDDDFATSVAFVAFIAFVIVFALVLATSVDDDAINNIDMRSWKHFLRAKLTSIAQFDQRCWCVRCVRYLDRRSRISNTLRHLCISLSDRQTKCDHCSHVEHRCNYDRASLQSQFLTRRATFRLLREMLNATKTMLMTTLVVWKDSHFVIQIS